MVGQCAKCGGQTFCDCDDSTLTPDANQAGNIATNRDGDSAGIGGDGVSPLFADLAARRDAPGFVGPESFENGGGGGAACARYAGAEMMTLEHVAEDGFMRRERELVQIGVHRDGSQTLISSRKIRERGWGATALVESLGWLRDTWTGSWRGRR